jgi:hypothetical protein
MNGLRSHGRRPFDVCAMQKGYKVYRVTLTLDQREMLTTLIESKLLRVRETNRASVLLFADEGESGLFCTDADIAIRLGLHEQTVHAVRLRFAEGGLTRVLAISKSSQRRFGRDQLAQSLAFKGWLTIADAAREFGYHAEHLQRLIRNGILTKSKRVDTKLFVARSELVAHMQLFRQKVAVPS